MTRRLSFAVAQPITIAGWFVSGFLLIGLLIAAAVPSSKFLPNPHPDYALTQAFYYGAMAAGLYIIIGIGMCITVIGAYTGQYDKDFKLTTAQRTLMLQTMIFMGYFLIGALVYKYVEGWAYLDALFWANFTLLTIGLGAPLVPATHLGRSLLFPFAIGGILTVGLVIGSIRSLVLERGSQKLHARFLEKRREASLKTLDEAKHTIKTSYFKKYSFSQDGLTEAQRREQEFHLMRKIQDESAWTQRYVALAMSSFATLALWLVGAAVFAVTERPQGWTYFTAIYFSYTSLLTIGYGDYQPQSNSGKPAFVLWTLLAVPTLTILISHMGDTVIKAFANLTLWAGKLTILPGDSAPRKRFKMAFKQVTKGHLLDPDELMMEKPPGLLPQPSKKESNKPKGPSIDQQLVEKLATHLEEDEIEDAMAAGEQGDKGLRDLHLYHYVLVRELKDIMMNIRNEPHKKYDYRDWAWYLKLLRQDESDESLHRKPKVKPTSGKKKGDKNGSWLKDEIGQADALGKSRKWSWLGIRSPLLSPRTESEWLIWRLGEILETEMRALRKGDPDDSPISLDDLLKRDKEEDDIERIREQKDVGAGAGNGGEKAVGESVDEEKGEFEDEMGTAETRKMPV
jgi:potassium channel subfamily K